jgi:hypothetical protein
MKMRTLILFANDLGQSTGTEHCYARAHVCNIAFSDGAKYVADYAVHLRLQAPSSNYRAVAAWSGILLFIGAGAFALGMAIHNESSDQQKRAHPEPLYYCVTGLEMPVFAPCKEMKGQRNI